jgi:uncharacterized membrane protein
MRGRIYVYGVMLAALTLSMMTGSLLSENRRENGVQIGLRVEPSTITVPVGSRGYAVVFITSEDEGEPKVSLKIVNPPENVRFQFNPTEGKLAPLFTSILIIEVNLNASEGTYPVQISALTNKGFSSANITLIIPFIEKNVTAYDSNLGNQGNMVGGFALRVDPSNQVLKKPGGSVKYAVTVVSFGGFREKVILGVEGLPEGAAAIFNPSEGRPDPVFRSNLQIFISQETSPGLYTFTVYAVQGENVQKTNATVKIESFNLIMVRRLKELKVEVESDRLKYNPGEAVRIFGHIYARGQFPSAKATILVQVVDSEGKIIHSKLLETTIGGYFSDRLTVESDWRSGSYTIFATASAEGFKDGFARTTFTVGSSTKPSVVVDSVYTTSVEGEKKEVFHPGESVVVWVLVNNSGANLNGGVVWVEVTDPLGIPLMVTAFGSNIGYMEQTMVWVQLKLNQDATPGLYEINALVSTGYISKGGKFIAGKEGAFLVSPS